MMLIALAFLSLTVPSFTQDTNGTNHVVDTKDDLGEWWAVPSESMGYSDNFSQFTQDATALANKVSGTPPPGNLTSIQGFKGLWWTLWDGIYQSWEGKATLNYIHHTQTLQYLSLSYALCGKSSITVNLQSQVVAVINNTKADNVNFTCDGLLKQSEFKLGRAYSISIELNVYSDKDVNGQPGFALIDKISTIDDLPATPGPRPNTTHHTWITVLPTTPIPSTTTEENGDGGVTFARLDAMLCAITLMFILAAVY